MATLTPRDAIKSLWAEKFFTLERGYNEIKSQIKKYGCNPSDASIWMALARTPFLARRGKKGNYRFVQKYPSKSIVLAEDVLPESLVAQLSKEFKTEMRDLKLNYGESGTCTAFLLRKILEKLIFLVFAQHGWVEVLKDGNGNLFGLSKLLDLAASTKVKGTPLMMTKTASSVGGIKFLGDTSAHNPLTNVEMRTVTQQMPFIVTAYQELVSHLN